LCIPLLVGWTIIFNSSHTWGYINTANDYARIFPVLKQEPVLEEDFVNFKETLPVLIGIMG
jgi:hypothetical protein